MTEQYFINDESPIDPHVVLHDQMISKMVQIGKIVEKKDGDPEQPTDGAYVLVHIGGEAEGTYTRNWMPWLVTRSGYDSEWWMPEQDEQVVVVAPSGNLALAIIIGTLYRGKRIGFDEESLKASADQEKKHVIPEEKKQYIHQRVYKDGTAVHYDRKEHQFQFQIIDSQAMDEKKETLIKVEKGKLEITAPNGISLTVGNSSLEMSEDKIMLKVGDSKTTTLTVTKEKVDVS